MDAPKRRRSGGAAAIGPSAVRRLLSFAAALLALVGTLAALAALTPAQALEPIVVDPNADKIEITRRGEFFSDRGDSLQVETAAGMDGVVGRMDVRAANPGTNPNWIVFALTNRSERHIERWLTADRYTIVGSGGVWPDLDASRIAAVTPSIGFVPERVKSDRADVFRITLEPGQTITLVAELSSERFARLFLWKPLDYELKVRERQLFNGALLGLTGLMAIFLTAIFAANHKAIFPTAALVAWCVLVYLCVDFGFFHKLFNLRPEDNAVYRAAGEASIAASLVIFLYTFLRLGLSHGLVRMLFAVWILAQLALIAVAVVDPRLAATFARLSFMLIGGAGGAIILFLAFRGQDRAMSLIPTWLLFLVWTFATAVTLTGRMSGDIVVAGLAAGIVLIVVLVGFTVTQFAFRSLEPAYASAPDEQQLRALAVDGVGAATWEWSARRDEIKVSPVLEAQLGLNMGELSTRVDDFLQYVHSGDRDRFRQVLWSVQERAGGRIRVEFRLRHSDSSYRWYELEAASVESADRKNVRCVGLLRDITDPKRTHERLLQDAVNCRVTGLPNRELLLDRLNVASRRAATESNIRPTIIFIDLDRFRSVNQNLGLLVGDSLLLTIARRLQRHIDESDTLARISGDQFALLLLEAQDPRELAGLAERIRRSLRSPIKIAGQEIVVTGSLGIAVYEGDGSSPEDLVKGAEIAMYRAKRKGADRIEIFNPDMRSDGVGYPIDDRELRKAFDAGQIKVRYQPIVYLPTEELAGFEAVLHYDHPKLKAIPHAVLIEVAEKGDLMKKVGGHLLSAALQDLSGWQRLLSREEAPLFVSVSISNAQLYRPEIVEEWRQIIGRGIVAPSGIRLAVTEELAMENPERAIEMMRVLDGTGAEIVLDRFGAGYSSMVYLSRFPAETFKLDRALVQAGTAGEGEGSAMVRSVTALAHELGRKVLADGIEIEDDVVFLRALGCEYGQGLYYGEPMPEREVVDLVKLIAKSERKLEAPGLFRTRPKRTKKPGETERERPAAAAAASATFARDAQAANGATPPQPAGEAESGDSRAARANGSQPPPPPMPSGTHPSDAKAGTGGSAPADRDNGQNGTDKAAQAPSSDAERMGQGRGADAPPPPPGGQAPSRTSEDVFKDARRALAGLPNLTVRPIDRPPGADKHAKPDRADGRPDHSGAVDPGGAARNDRGNPPTPPPAGNAPDRPTDVPRAAPPTPPAQAADNNQPRPPAPPKAGEARPASGPPPVTGGNAAPKPGNGVVRPPPPPPASARRAEATPDATGEGEKRQPPAPPKQPAGYAPKAPNGGQAESRSEARPGNASATPAAGAVKPPAPPAPPSGGTHGQRPGSPPPPHAPQAGANGGDPKVVQLGPSLADQFFGPLDPAQAEVSSGTPPHSGPANPPSGTGFGAALEKLSHPSQGENPAEQGRPPQPPRSPQPSAPAGPAGRAQGGEPPRMTAAVASPPPGPPHNPKPNGAAGNGQAPGPDDNLPPTERRRPPQPPPGASAQPPRTAPPPPPGQGKPGDPYGHLPPGIAASLARLAGKQGEKPKGAARLPRRAPEAVGGKPDRKEE